MKLWRLEVTHQYVSPAINDGHQLICGIHPTKFVIHSNFSSKIPTNYKRYLINSFRNALSLNSVELSIIFKKGDNPYEGKKNQLSPRQIKKKKRLVKYTKKNK